ncbi:MAG: inositol monophosphatase family protein, partial [Anaerolineae bacterium]
MLKTAVEAAQRAGRLIAERYPRMRNAHYKGYRDLVTETDIAAERAILDLIRERFPEHAILSEETAGGAIGPEYTWVIDPLDGTSNFTHGVPIFS